MWTGVIQQVSSGYCVRLSFDAYHPDYKLPILHRDCSPPVHASFTFTLESNGLLWVRNAFNDIHNQNYYLGSECVVLDGNTRLKTVYFPCDPLNQAQHFEFIPRPDTPGLGVLRHVDSGWCLHPDSQPYVTYLTLQPACDLSLQSSSLFRFIPSRLHADCQCRLDRLVYAQIQHTAWMCTVHAVVGNDCLTKRQFSSTKVGCAVTPSLSPPACLPMPRSKQASCDAAAVPLISTEPETPTVYRQVKLAL